MPHVPSRTRRRLVAATLVSFIPLPRIARASASRGWLLAREFGPDDDPAGYLVSEKYDGVRAQWDGQVLRLRGGGTVAAPADFLAHLPATPLDGELWMGRGRFDAASAAVRRERPDAAEWQALRYMVFELPGAPGPFSERAQAIARLVAAAGHPQLVAVAHSPVADRVALMHRLQQVVSTGGEGLALHRADAPYATGRGDVLLKLKPQQDAEAEVIGHLPGRGRHAGRLGALRVRTEAGVVFDIGTGFTDAQREAPPPPGSWVTFRYRGLTAQGVPRFASFLRLHEGA